MREIKFRGKRIDNGEWVYGCLTRYSDRMSYIVVDVTENNGTYQVLTETVGQYTGLKDRNGKEIYEGDIIKSTRGYTAFVEWTDDGRFLGRTHDRSIVYVGQEPAAEVIGNIHDNPELLTA